VKNKRFRTIFVTQLLQSCYDFQANNIDFSTVRMSRTRASIIKVIDRLLLIAKRFGFVRIPSGLEATCERLNYVFDHLEAFESLYDQLEDSYSKSMLIDLLRFRVLGNRKVKLPINHKGYWEMYHSVDPSFRVGTNLLKTHGNWNWDLPHYRMPGRTGDIDMYTHRSSILDTFLLEQLVYKGAGNVVEAESGDFVIDGGGCWGHTSLFLADRIGPTGKVFSFEFVPGNLKVFSLNISLNPKLADRIVLRSEALWNRSGEAIPYVEYGPGSSITEARNPNWTGKNLPTASIVTTSIDDFVKSAGVDKINFIKLDVEGSEFKALQGAQQTIRTFRPKLAVSIYHKQEDFVTIPAFLSSLGVSYKFFLGHFSIGSEGTILFAKPS
jgi:FkbM family methyltransferase